MSQKCTKFKAIKVKIQRLCVQIQTKNKTSKPTLDMFKNSLSFSCALIWKNNPVEIRNVNTIDALTWIKEF